MKFPISVVILSAIFSVSSHLCGEIPVKSGDKVAFLGDSITQAGQNSAGGYVQLIGKALEANGVKIEIIGAGISGHKSNQMLERLDRDVLSKKPQWMTLSCGVNDVWHGEKGVTLEDYKKNITEIVTKAQAAGVKVVILTSTMIQEDQSTPANQKLVAYNEFLRVLAREKKCLLADLNAEMQSALAEAAKSQPSAAKANVLTSDGVHMAFAGNQMMAIGVLKGLGLSAAELTKGTSHWLDLPDTSNVSAKMGLSQRQVQQLQKVANARKVSVNTLIQEEFNKLVTSLLNPKP